MPQDAPLTALTSWVWVALTIETDNAFEQETAPRVGRCVRISLPMWTNALRHVDEAGVTLDELHTRTRAAANVPGLERWGWVQVGEPAAPRRAGFGTSRGLDASTVLRPTRAGSYARRAWPRVVVAVEQAWRTRFGDAVVDALAGALTHTLSAVPAYDAHALPWSPPEISPAHGFTTAVIADDGTGSTGGRPLAALLGQALTHLTLEHERAATVALPLGADLLRVLGDAPVPRRDLPRRGGVSKEAVAMALTHLVRQRLVDPSADGALALTAEGRAARDDYETRTAGVVDEGLGAALLDVLTRTDALSAGLTPPPGGWRGDGPYRAATRRMLADPTGSLPWQPMVLHRGGWPDGS